MDEAQTNPERFAGAAIATVLFGATAFGLAVVVAASMGLFA